MSEYACKNDPDKFCYVCGSLTFKGETRKISEIFKFLHSEYFKRNVSHQDENFVPHSVCASCYGTFRLWSTGDRKGMPFGTPMLWAKPSISHEDCYFRNCEIEGYNRKNRKSIIYPECRSSRRPVPHTPNLPIPPTPWRCEENMNEDCDSGIDIIDLNDFDGYTDETPGPRLIDQKSSNDFVRDLGLTKQKAELCSSRLQERGMLAPVLRTGILANREPRKKSGVGLTRSVIVASLCEERERTAAAC
ncbi:hypothetical protein QAD02_007171 [Eretmocerus hayati]|uniref:Uncharacterized protein n=1 Tax=Eretmocerus hayati TaxID=131215 RepID=A0ACC2N5A6_9HYME|nr:hypothetical protein QAD02_007171 [Eretmocerus hayati]